MVESFDHVTRLLFPKQNCTVIVGTTHIHRKRSKTNNMQKHPRLVPIIPAPAVEDGSKDPGTAGGASELTMPYTCQNCVKRKVKCNKALPVCSSCYKGKLDCSYQAPLPRSRKRRKSDDLLQKLAHYERILQKHGLLDHDSTSEGTETPQQNRISLAWHDHDTPGGAKLLASQGKSRYVASSLWRTLGDDAIQNLSDGEDEDDDDATTSMEDRFMPDPLTGAFLDAYSSLSHYHPPYDEALVLWQTHIENVEPICKILHVPSVEKIARKGAQNPDQLSKSEECLLFAIYHFAVFSMSEGDCLEKLGQPRAFLIQRYHLAVRKALVNASFLKTTEMTVLQAYMLFLLSCRFYYDPNTFWVLTGVAVRIAQRMGLHRDGEELGLPPFEVQMKRRLFYQLLPVEGIASQMSGAGMSISVGTWDTKLPLNINDNQIWPGMTETPEQQKGATEMIFALSRCTIGKFFAKTGVYNKSLNTFKDQLEAEKAINEAESEVEENFIRYCDIINPLHFLAIGLARSGIKAMRLRVRLPKIKNQTASDGEIRELLKLSQTIMDTDSAAYDNKSIMKFHWYIMPFFLWGMWDSFILVLTNLWKRSDLFSPTETTATWKRVEQVYKNHTDLLEGKRALYIAFGRLAVKAWDASPARSSMPEPGFITTLRIPRKQTPRSQNTGENSGTTSPAEKAPTNIVPLGPSVPNPVNEMTNDAWNITSLDSIGNFEADAGDWALWDQLMQDYQTEIGN